MVSRENVSWLTTIRNDIYFQKMDNNEKEIGYVISTLARNCCYLNHYLKNVLNNKGKELIVLNPSIL